MRENLDEFPNLTVKKIPKAVLYPQKGHAVRGLFKTSDALDGGRTGPARFL